jgi:hypothetical protein
MGIQKSKEQLLDELQDLRQEELRLTSKRVPLLILARESGASWREVGAALGVTGQAAQQAYAKYKHATYVMPIPDGQDPILGL